ncbi:aspartyl/asparaginyl beta-hydroxylase domain-containing protein [Roseateles sp. GG27B]
MPPHVGVSNARFVTQVPLIIPPDCGCSFRVGNQRRQGVSGQAWVFDDTMEHEAWNDSKQLRVLLNFDIWHPELTAVKRRMITALTEAQNLFQGRAGGLDL